MKMPLVRFDMSEFQEKHSVAKFIGAPPGYVGYEDGTVGAGLLVNEIEKHPYAVLLLDEVEKAHMAVTSVLLQIMDYGFITGSNGKKADLRNVIIIMTSNMGTKKLNHAEFGFGNSKSDEGYQKMKLRVLEDVQNIFSPELMNRIDESIVFHALTEENVYDIIDLQMIDLVQNLSKLGLGLKLTKTAKKQLAKNGYDPKYGARPLRRVIQKQIEDPLSFDILKKKYSEGSTVIVDMKEGKLLMRKKRNSSAVKVSSEELVVSNQQQ